MNNINIKKGDFDKFKVGVGIKAVNRKIYIKDVDEATRYYFKFLNSLKRDDYRRYMQRLNEKVRSKKHKIGKEPYKAVDFMHVDAVAIYVAHRDLEFPRIDRNGELIVERSDSSKKMYSWDEEEKEEILPSIYDEYYKD